MSVHVDHVPIRTLLLDYVGGSNPIYLGLANAGMATDNTGWQIRKVTYDGSNNPTAIQFANGSSAFDMVWDNRANMIYS